MATDLTVRPLEGLRDLELISVSLPAVPGRTRHVEEERARTLQLVARNEPVDTSLGSACQMVERSI